MDKNKGRDLKVEDHPGHTTRHGNKKNNQEGCSLRDILLLLDKSLLFCRVHFCGCMIVDFSKPRYENQYEATAGAIPNVNKSEDELHRTPSQENHQLTELKNR